VKKYGTEKKPLKKSKINLESCKLWSLFFLMVDYQTGAPEIIVGFYGPRNP
jgi:hypothetical protein